MSPKKNYSLCVAIGKIYYPPRASFDRADGKPHGVGLFTQPSYHPLYPNFKSIWALDLIPPKSVKVEDID